MQPCEWCGKPSEYPHCQECGEGLMDLLEDRPSHRTEPPEFDESPAAAVTATPNQPGEQ